MSAAVRLQMHTVRRVGEVVGEHLLLRTHVRAGDHACRVSRALTAAVPLPQVVTELGTADIDARLEELLIDGILYAFQEQVSDDANVMLNGFGTVVNALKVRSRCACFCSTDYVTRIS